MIFYSLALATTALLLLLACAFSFTMNWLATKKRAQAIVVRHENRAKALFPWVVHVPHCRCSAVTGVHRHCRNLTLLAVAIERKKLAQKKNAGAVTPTSNSIHLN